MGRAKDADTRAKLESAFGKPDNISQLGPTEK